MELWRRSVDCVDLGVTCEDFWDTPRAVIKTCIAGICLPEQLNLTPFERLSSSTQTGYHLHLQITRKSLPSISCFHLNNLVTIFALISNLENVQKSPWECYDKIFT